MTAYGRGAISRDVSGNPTSYYNGTRWAFTWTNGRNLTTASDGDTSISYTYDASGLRTGKTVDGVTHSYLYASGKLLRESYGSTTLDFFYDENGRPYAFTQNGTIYYYVTNLQGDVVGILNSNGTTVGTYEYDPYGNVTSMSGALAGTNPIRYRGYYYDKETGFYYLQSRYYDPSIGRFINADSVASTGQGIMGYNMFAYCNNNPVNMIDTGGHWPKWVTGVLNVVSGFAQAAAGAALGATLGWTGAGAVVAGFLVLNGAATATQGIAQIHNYCTNSTTLYEDNVIEACVTELGQAIGGDTGAVVANGAYHLAETTACIYAGKIQLQQAGVLPIKVDINNIVNNPADEFVTIGPAEGVVSQYCRTIPVEGYGRIYVTQLDNGLYQIANGHHRIEALRQLGEEIVKVYLTR